MRVKHALTCLHWCLPYAILYPLPYRKDTFPLGCINYEFTCADCSDDGKEKFERIDLGFRGVLIAALQELRRERDAKEGTSDEEVVYFDLKDEIVK